MSIVDFTHDGFASQCSNGNDLKMIYDLFVCHASEDKKSFVRPLAAALKKENVAVWYDEFSLKLGDSIRRSIDKGLKQSRYGVVVLSKAFFEKQWGQYELDGLAEREMKGQDKVILPIWHGVTHDEILAYSPSLAGRKAISSSTGLKKIVDEILDVLRPQGSPLIVARDTLLEWGLTPPVITDEYWLSIVEASNRLPGFGPHIPEESSWDRWSFPLPDKGDTAQTWGDRLAWTALQQNWVVDADRIPVSVITPPAEVLAFIKAHPGLIEICDEFPSLIAEYSPQLTIPGMGGELETTFEREYLNSCAEYSNRHPAASSFGSALTTTGNSPLCDERWCLRHSSFANYNAIHISSEYFNGGMFGPRVAYHAHPDHAFWLLSRASLWLPDSVRDVLLDGMRRWITWPWGRLRDDNGGDWRTCGALADALDQSTEGKAFRWSADRTDDLTNRIQLSIERMNLPDSVEEILNRFLKYEFVENYLKTARAHKQRKPSSSDGSRRRNGHDQPAGTKENVRTKGRAGKSGRESFC